MRQVVQVFRKDCRHLWPVIAAVLVLMALHAYGDAISGVSSMGVAVGLSPLAVLYALVGISAPVLFSALLLLVARVVQEEALVGTEQFWLTRPYDRVCLILEKILFLALFASVPLLLHDIAILSYLRFSLSGAFNLLLWKQAQLWVFLLVAATIATLTRTLAQFALAVIGTALFGLCLLYITAASEQGAFFQTESALYAGLGLLVLFTIVSVALIAYQYLQRRTKFTIVCAIAFMFAGFALVRWWPQRLTAYLEQKSTPREMSGIHLRLDPQMHVAGRSLAEFADIRDQKEYLMFVLPFEVTGVSPGVGVELTNGGARLQSSAGQTIPLVLPSYVHFLTANAGDPLFDRNGPYGLVPFLAGDGRALRLVTDKKGLLKGQLFLEGFRISRQSFELGTSPLTQQGVDIGQQHCRLTSSVREQRADLSIWCVGLEPGRVLNLHARLVPEPQFGSSGGGNSQSGGQGTWVSFFSPVSRVMASWQFEHQPGGQPNEPPETMRDRRVELCLEEKVGSVVQDFEVEHFRPADYDLAAWQQRGLQAINDVKR